MRSNSQYIPDVQQFDVEDALRIRDVEVHCVRLQKLSCFHPFLGIPNSLVFKELFENFCSFFFSSNKAFDTVVYVSNILQFSEQI